MDLRSYTTATHLARAKQLAFRGLLNYQPYRFSNDFAVGSGLSVLRGGQAGPQPSIDCADAEQWATPARIAEAVVTSSERQLFCTTNARMAEYYDDLVERIAGNCGGIRGWSVLDFGCNAGYFSIRAMQHGAGSVLAIDREPYHETFDLLNDICGTTVSFRRGCYSGELNAGMSADLVLSVAVLNHLSEPLRHLTYLASAAQKALAVFTSTHADQALTVKYHASNRFYENAQFPFSFDAVSLSRPLIEVSLKALGFREVYDVTAACAVMGENWPRSHVGLVGVR